MENLSGQMETEEERCQQWSDYVEVFRKPAVWMVSLLIITSYSLQVAFEYTTSYMTQVLGITAMFAGVVATLRDNICGLIGLHWLELGQIKKIT